MRVENQTNTGVWEDSSLCPETSTKNAVQECRLSSVPSSFLFGRPYPVPGKHTYLQIFTVHLDDFTDKGTLWKTWENLGNKSVTRYLLEYFVQHKKDGQAGIL